MRGKAYGRFSPGRQRTDTTQDRSAWLMTYADAVTLLLAFFIMLYTFSEIDMQRFSEFVEGLRTPFGNVAADGVLDGSHGIMSEPQPAPEELQEVREELLHGIEEMQSFDVTVLEGITAEAAELAYLRERAELQLDEIEVALDDALATADMEQFVDHHREDRGLVVTISSDDILFELGSTQIGTLGAEVIEVVSKVLHEFDNPVQIEGHTDDVPIRRDGYTNWNLSTDRAVAVLSRMIEEHGLPPERVGAVGYGEHHPVATNDTPQGRARNRRVDIIVLIDPWDLP